jgi:hypothetical protein
MRKSRIIISERAGMFTPGLWRCCVYRFVYCEPYNLDALISPLANGCVNQL